MSFYRKFDMGTLAIRAIPASPESSNSKLAGIVEGLSPKTRAMAMLADACEGLSLNPDALREALGDDDASALENGEVSPELLRAFAIAFAQRRKREAGEVPDDWTHIAWCAQCGPVYLWAPLKVQACPWCFNRVAGRPMPTVSESGGRACTDRHLREHSLGGLPHGE